MRSSEDILRSAKRVLDEYADGYDRAAAAAAIGIGSYREITDALSITNESWKKLVSGWSTTTSSSATGTQEAVSAYEKAVADFNRESDLMAQGFKKAIADQIMPILTDLAVFFRMASRSS